MGTQHISAIKTYIIFRNDALATQRATMNLMNHMHSFHTKQSAEAKQERINRMRRARSMPKLEDEEVSRMVFIADTKLFHFRIRKWQI